MNDLTDYSKSINFTYVLAAIGAVSFIGFFTLFMNIPWEWNMFMDDIYYGTWMPKVPSIYEGLRDEISTYWKMGRFYPVKYLMNLLKWKFLPNDPTVFRYFNFIIYTLSVSIGALASMRAVSIKWEKVFFPFLLFLIGTSLLHKPLLETISLNPLGETWVCLFFAVGVFFLFSESNFCRYFLARAFFILVALSKEPAALVFFASSLHYLTLIWRTSEKRREFLTQAVIDFLFFALFLSLALYAMSHGTFTKQAYFSETPWARYAKDFVYKLVRYGIWTAPFIFAFLVCIRELRWNFLAQFAPRSLAAFIFFLVFGFTYLIFMSTQGIVAYQEVPASMAFYCLFCSLAFGLWRSGTLEAVVQKYALLLLVVFSLSYFIVVSRWERFVRGIVEPNKILVNLLSTGQKMTILMPEGEVQWHAGILAEKLNPEARIVSIVAPDEDVIKSLRGTIYVLEFPIYMGNLNSDLLGRRRDIVGGWAAVVSEDSYRIYRGNKNF